MSENTSEPTATSQKSPRRSTAALKSFLQSRIKALEAKDDIKIKKSLERLAKECTDLQAKRPGDPKIGQAGTLLSAAAAGIKVEMPQ